MLDRDHPDRTRSALSRLGSGLARHPKAVVVGWLLAIVAGFAGSSGFLGGDSLFERLHHGEPSVDGEAQTGRDLIVASGKSELTTYLVRVESVDLQAPETARAAARAVREITQIEGVASAVNPYVLPRGLADPQAAPFLKSGDGSDGFLTVVTFEGDPDSKRVSRLTDEVDTVFEGAQEALPRSHLSAGGLNSLITAITDQLEQDLRTGEGIALPFSFVVMVLVFGGFVAAGMPLLGAIASIAGALASLLGFSYLIELDASAVNVVTVMGLGLCIDYGLLVVSRFREELRNRAQGLPAAEIPAAKVREACARTVDSAGRTVVFSGLTVAISLGGLLVFEAQFMKAVGAAGLSVVVIAMLVALTLVPALCVLGARRLLRKGTELAPEEGVFSRLALWVQRRPLFVIAASLAALVTLALPALDLRLTSSGSDLLPQSNSQRQFWDGLEAGYPAFGGADVRVVTESSLEQARAYAAQLPTVPGAAVRGAQALDSTHAVIDIDVPGDGLGDPARDQVDLLQADRPEFPTFVTGQASAVQDFIDSLWDRADIAFGMVALATLVLLFLMTGSVVIPIKALLLNVVSLGACLGVLAWVFQDGHLEGLLAFDSVGAVEVSIPPLILAFGFGLSMDYEVFLLSRIVELHERGHSNDDAVVVGLQRSGRIITSAALLIVIVFSGFAAGQLLVIKQTGVGLATAVFVDATLVRMLLVPATMTVLGDWNWWAPTPLKRWHARYGITE